MKIWRHFIYIILPTCTKTLKLSQRWLSHSSKHSPGLQTESWHFTLRLQRKKKRKEKKKQTNKQTKKDSNEGGIWAAPVSEFQKRNEVLIYSVTFKCKNSVFILNWEISCSFFCAFSGFYELGAESQPGKGLRKVPWKPHNCFHLTLLPRTGGQGRIHAPSCSVSCSAEGVQCPLACCF